MTASKTFVRNDDSKTVTGTLVIEFSDHPSIRRYLMSDPAYAKTSYLSTSVGPQIILPFDYAVENLSGTATVCVATIVEAFRPL